MKGRDPYDYSRQIQSGKSMGEFGPNYKQTHKLVLDYHDNENWNQWKVKKEVHVKKKRKKRSLSNVSNLLGKWLNRLIN